MLATILIAALGVGEGSQTNIADVVLAEDPFAVTSTWELVWFEENGKREKRRGKLQIDLKGSSALHVFPMATWTILAHRTSVSSGIQSVDLDLEWEGEFAGKDTILGIYDLKGDHLSLCFVSNGAKRPSEFATRAGDRRTLLLFKRIK